MKKIEAKLTTEQLYEIYLKDIPGITLERLKRMKAITELINEGNKNGALFYGLITN